MEAKEGQTPDRAPNVKVMDTSSDEFVNKYLPLYAGPHVKIGIGSSGQEYTLSKAVLYKHSQFFAKIFGDDSLYAEGDIVIVEELGAISLGRNFKL
ncbi:hypothetical protein NA56DRAFT_705440 [Hyaloscypha hepaticicola]|uniref:BTB domain-containing protein n=1 Tax=Hyaloscypha hepaticicola TaxID=2082293 RepID=A0A2J6Q0D9_9HELO|nr:hypothetical protein NA56DRAFT_705440 [Hyaloscypha hepaticicola]